MARGRNKTVKLTPDQGRTVANILGLALADKAISKEVSKNDLTDHPKFGTVHMVDEVQAIADSLVAQAEEIENPPPAKSGDDSNSADGSTSA